MPRVEPPATNPSFLALDGYRLAYRHHPGSASGIVFCGGFRSDMTGTKAAALERACIAAGRAYTRFDYRGHGASEGRFEECTIGHWTDDALAIIDRVTAGKLVLVGSSMGGWIMLLAALARHTRVAGLVGIAAAPDFTERLMWPSFTDAQRQALARDGVVYEPSAYDPEPYPITRGLIEDGRQRLLLGAPILLDCPVRLLHGMQDPDVPWRLSLELAERLASDDVRVELVKDGDHRLSRDADIELITHTVLSLAAANDH